MKLTLLALASSIVACSRPAELQVMVDSDTAAAEVLAVSFDPSPIIGSHQRAVATRDPRTDSLVLRYVALAESVAALDTGFQKRRAELNLLATSLGRGDRRSPEYARQYDGFRRARDSALHLRDARDRVRGRLAALRTRHPDLPLAAAVPHPSPRNGSARSSLDSAARAAGGRVVRAPLESGRARLRLEPRTWWLLLGGSGGELRGSARRVDLHGSRDTLRLP